MLHQLFASRSDNTLIQLFRYTFVGGFAFMVDIGSLYALTEFLQFHYLVSAAIAFMLGLVVNYRLSVIWVFSRRAVRSKWVEFAVFAGVGIIGLVFNELIIWFFTEKVALYYLLSKIISAVFVYLWNFVARKFLLFN